MPETLPDEDEPDYFRGEFVIGDDGNLVPRNPPPQTTKELNERPRSEYNWYRENKFLGLDELGREILWVVDHRPGYLDDPRPGVFLVIKYVNWSYRWPYNSWNTDGYPIFAPEPPVPMTDQELEERPEPEKLWYSQNPKWLRALREVTYS